MRCDGRAPRLEIRHALGGRIAFAVGVLIVTGLLVSGPVALARTPAAPSPPAKDTIFARKTTMGTIDLNMDQVEEMLAPGGKLESADAREHLDIISVLLMAFPHLFPRNTNQWKAGADRDPATDTFASPQVWTNFKDFYARSNSASKLAFAASRALRLDEFRKQVAELRTQCNACHALYHKPQ